MELSHSCNDGLSRFRIGMLAERRIFFCKFGKCRTQLILSGFRLRLDCELDNRLREFHVCIQVCFRLRQVRVAVRVRDKAGDIRYGIGKSLQRCIGNIGRIGRIRHGVIVSVAI